MYDCSKIKRLTVLYTSKGPGSYAGEQRKVLEAVESRAICEEANSREISIEMLLKEREDVAAVVINTIIPFEQPVKTEIPESAKKAKEEEAAGEQKKEQGTKPEEKKGTEEPVKDEGQKKGQEAKPEESNASDESRKGNEKKPEPQKQE